VRMALGASRESVVSLILRQSARLALIGTVAGLALALGVSQLVSSFVVGLGPADPIAFGIATVVLIGVLFAASWSPARRAARMDPMHALRAE
jgi:putative ABC transport system permease protein